MGAVAAMVSGGQYLSMLCRAVRPRTSHSSRGPSQSGRQVCSAAQHGTEAKGSRSSLAASLLTPCSGFSSRLGARRGGKQLWGLPGL